VSDKPTNDPVVKKRKIRATDWQSVEDFIKKELDLRKNSDFRKDHERIWTEVDRQIAMKPMTKYLPDGKEAPRDWTSAFELGELSKASEIITADVMRLIFPANRTWFEAHVKPPTQLDQNTGKRLPVDQKIQQKADAVLRSLLAQQHLDFGLRSRVELSVKESLHHGSFVSTVEWDIQNKIYDGKGVESLEAPIWKPHSMWNSYPDMSPSVIPDGNIFYPGSMMIVSYMKRYKVLELKGEGYMNISNTKIPKRKNSNKEVDTDDIEIVTYYGDLVIERDDGDIFLPNSKCQTANDTIIFYAPNDMPFPPVIYMGYERQDVRDPYFTSPIVKNSPMQKMTTILANKFIDGVALWTSPPGTYDGNDAYLVRQGGPTIAPGYMSPSKGSNKVTFMTVGDPKAALSGVQFGLQKIEEGTAVNAIRSGASDSDRKTATEVTNTQQSGEVRTVDFVAKIEPSGLKRFLYMQHEFNLKYMKDYSFYCPEKDLPDFISLKKQDLPQIVHFEIVGSKGVLGEQRRSQQMTAVTAFASQNPLFAPLLNAPQILIDMYEDAGVKGAELYVNTQKPQIPPQVQAQMQQMQQQLQEMGQELQKAKSGEAAAMAKIDIQRREAEANFALERARLETEKAQAMSAMKADAADIVRKANESIAKLEIDRKDTEARFALEAASVKRQFELEQQRINDQRALDKQEMDAKIALAEQKATERAAAAGTKKVKIKRTQDGYEVN
jgi:hypothetical protein